MNLGTGREARLLAECRLDRDQFIRIGTMYIDDGCLIVINSEGSATRYIWSCKFRIQCPFLQSFGPECSVVAHKDRCRTPKAAICHFSFESDEQGHDQEPATEVLELLGVMARSTSISHKVLAGQSRICDPSTQQPGSMVFGFLTGGHADDLPIPAPDLLGDLLNLGGAVLWYQISRVNVRPPPIILAAM